MDRQTDKCIKSVSLETGRQIERQTGRCTAIRQDRPIDVCIIRHNNIRTGWQTNRQAGAQKDRCTKRRIKEQTGEQ